MPTVDELSEEITRLRGENERLWTWLAERHDPPAEIAKIIRKYVCAELDVEWEMVISECRQAELCEARREIAYHLRQNGWTTERIGRLLHRDHSTVCHMLNARAAVHSQFKAAAE